MVEYKSYLKLKIPQRNNVMGLSWERYAVASCSYDLWKDADKNGEPNSKAKGGTIRVALSDLPNDALMA